MTSLFDEIGQTDTTYENIRSSSHPVAIQARGITDQLWQDFESFADSNFKDEIKIDFHSRFWEMYLTCHMLTEGENISCPKPGPDILITRDESHIWLEAIAPNQGAIGAPDRVPDLELDAVQDHPEKEIILRYRAAIYEKHNNKYKNYLRDGIINETDPFVICINSSKIQLAFPYSTVPEIVKAVLPIGHLRVKISNVDFKPIDTGYTFRPVVKKKSGNTVDTNIFLNKEYENISGILFSPVSSISVPHKSGSEMLFIHNPLAKNPLPIGFFNFGIEYYVKEVGDYIELLSNDYN